MASWPKAGDKALPALETTLDVLGRAVPGMRERGNLKGHEASATQAAFSRDGKLVATSSDDGTARVWDSGNGRELAVIKGHKGEVNGVVFFPETARIATAGQDGTVRIWDWASGKEISSFRGTFEAAHFVDVSADGTWLAAATSDGSVVWDLRSGTVRHTIRPTANRQSVLSARFAPDSRRIVIANYGGAMIFDATTGRRLIELKSDQPIVNAAFSADGTRIVSTYYGTAATWNAATGVKLVEMDGHGRDGPLNDAGFSPDGKRVVSASRDGTARVWDAEVGSSLMVLAGHDGGVAAASFSPDGTRLVTAGFDGTAKIWDVATGAHTTSSTASRSKKGSEHLPSNTRQVLRSIPTPRR